MDALGDIALQRGKHSEAIRWYSKAAQHGDIGACESLKELSAEGFEVDVDYEVVYGAALERFQELE